MKLTDNEKRDAIKLIAAGKPLPDKYRFLLFGDDREVLTQHWTDWIDYWSVDFDFENKREIIALKNEETGEMEEHWTGDFVFENEWQSFRTKKDRDLELKTPFHECAPGRYKVEVKVVDIFGNDTMKIVGVTI